MQILNRFFLNFFFLIAWILPGFILGQGDFYVNREVIQIYDQAFDLKLNKTKKELLKARKNQPDNMILIFLEHYADFLQAFTSEDGADIKILEKQFRPRLDRISKGNKNNPYRLFLQAEMYLHAALIHLKVNETLSAVQDIRKANDLLNKNKLTFPSFTENDKSLAIIKGLAGTIPDNYKGVVGAITGLEGSVTEAIRMIQRVTERLKGKQNGLFYRESVIIYAMMVLHLGEDKEKAWKIMELNSFDPARSVLAAYAKAHVARASGRTGIAIKILEDRPAGPEYSSFPLLELMLGINKLHRLDPGAQVHLIRFIRNNKGHNYIKEAYQKLAWYSIAINNDQATARIYFNACQTKGFADSEEDRSALVEAKSGILPHRQLLRVRLLMDGGYHEKSLDLLLEKRVELEKADALQTCYFMGRNYQLAGRPDEALRYFNRLLREWPESDAYQVCNAALQSGLIYEKKGEKEKAISFYRKCLNLDPDKYKSGMHQKAKAGLNRLNK